jgi:predicted GIY-YIG superfamily endonuclease
MKTVKVSPRLIEAQIRMWPRQVFWLKNGNKHFESIKATLREKPGIYILYKSDGTAYYVGQARNLWQRLRKHAINQNAKYYYHWTHFSTFILCDTEHMDELEAFAISAFSTGIVNSSRPRIKRILLPKDVAKELSKLVNIP